MLVVDQLLSAGAEVRESRPALRPGSIGGFAIGRAPAAAMLLGLVLLYAPGVPGVLRAIGATSFLLVPPALAAIIGYRRSRALPPDLRELARSEVHASSTRVRPSLMWVTLAVVIVVGTLSLVALLGGS
jgi:hypothetical protein